jgi:hypothetical protein
VIEEGREFGRALVGYDGAGAAAAVLAGTRSFTAIGEARMLPPR